jgi:hypothetical protein
LASDWRSRSAAIRRVLAFAPIAQIVELPLQAWGDRDRVRRRSGSRGFLTLVFSRSGMETDVLVSSPKVPNPPPRAGPR